MCVLHCFDCDAKPRHIDRIVLDWQTNNDGGSVCFLNDEGDVFLRCQCVELQQLIDLLWLVDASRYMVHLRMSTTPVDGVQGCHMFDSPDGSWTYAHNGVIYTQEAKRYRVDSLVLGNELERANSQVHGTVTNGLPDWQEHDFANVLALDNLSGTLYVHRSEYGKLTTDHNGNWSTVAVDGTYHPLKAGWYNVDGSAIHLYGRPSDRYRYLDYVETGDRLELPIVDSEYRYDVCSSCDTLCVDDELTMWGEYPVCDDCMSALEPERSGQ